MSAEADTGTTEFITGEPGRPRRPWDQSILSTCKLSLRRRIRHRPCGDGIGFQRGAGHLSTVEVRHVADENGDKMKTRLTTALDLFAGKYGFPRCRKGRWPAATSPSQRSKGRWWEWPPGVELGCHRLGKSDGAFGPPAVTYPATNGTGRRSGISRYKSGSTRRRNLPWF